MRRDPEVIRVYSRSLLAAVKPTGKLPEYIADAVALCELYLSQPRLRAFLEGPHVREQDKEELVVKVFGEGRIMPLLYNLLRLLVHKKRTLFLPDILEAFQVVGEEELGHVVGKVTTAIQLAAAKQEQLQKRLEEVTGLNFTLDWKVDPEVLGGVLVNYKDVQIDGTLRGRLNSMRAQLEALV